MCPRDVRVTKPGYFGEEKEESHVADMNLVLERLDSEGTWLMHDWHKYHEWHEWHEWHE